MTKNRNAVSLNPKLLTLGVKEFEKRFNANKHWKGLDWKVYWKRLGGKIPKKKED